MTFLHTVSTESDDGRRSSPRLTSAVEGVKPTVSRGVAASIHKPPSKVSKISNVIVCLNERLFQASLLEPFSSLNSFTG